ncbi:MAG: hypothetical protein KDN22_25955 [Verrucomicrobiae bacterium]|nr:hypothetical protein [Verrucomicrobiae bacterium]
MRLRADDFRGLTGIDGDFLHPERAQFLPQLALGGHRAGNLVVVAVEV